MPFNFLFFFIPHFSDPVWIKKTRKYIRVHGPHERNGLDDVDGSENMVEALHRACHLWQRDERETLNRFLENNTFTKREAFWQFAQAVSQTFDKADKNTKEKKWLDGILVQHGDSGMDSLSHVQKEIFNQ